MRWLPFVLVALLAVAAALHLGRRERGTIADGTLGASLYRRHCASCHGPVALGNAQLPALRNGTGTDTDLRTVIVHGKGRMAGVDRVRGADLDSLVRYVQGER